MSVWVICTWDFKRTKNIVFRAADVNRIAVLLVCVCVSTYRGKDEPSIPPVRHGHVAPHSEFYH